MSDFDETRDFVVVGSGGGSMCAALVMRCAAKDVLVLEKTDLIGGTTARSGGVMWIPDNPFMARDGVHDSFEKASKYLDAVVGDHVDQPGASRERRTAYLRADLLPGWSGSSCIASKGVYRCGTLTTPVNRSRVRTPRRSRARAPRARRCAWPS